jgi:hypothetical protein
MVSVGMISCSSWMQGTLMNQRIVHHETFCAIQHSMRKFAEGAVSKPQQDEVCRNSGLPGRPGTNKSVHPVNAALHSSQRYYGKERKKSKPFIIRTGLLQ